MSTDMKGVAPSMPEIWGNEEDKDHKPIFQGWINKQGGGRNNGYKNWRRRWFVLSCDSMDYYASEAKARCLGSMDITRADLRVFPTESEAKKPDWENKDHCHICTTQFNLTTRRHHCRRCGWSLCQTHSKWNIELPTLGIFVPTRVCQRCYVKARRELREFGIESSSEAPKSPSKEKPLRRASRKTLTLPTVQKRNLFVLKNSNRELWLHTDQSDQMAEWVKAIKKVLQDLRTAEAQKVARHPQWQLDFKKITEMSKITDGAFGIVYKAKLWHTPVAVKILKTDRDSMESLSQGISSSNFDNATTTSPTDKMIVDLKKEIGILSQLRHPNIVLYIGACPKLPNVCIVMEWCARGCLFDMLHNPSFFMDTSLLIRIAHGIAQGMNYLHSLAARIVHRDLKSHNVLLDHNMTAKIADFGLSHMKQRSIARPVVSARGRAKTDTKEMGGIFGTPEWMAPEIMEGLNYNQKVDIYSFGIVLCEMTSREVPFNGQFATNDPLEIIEGVLEDGAIPDIPAWCNTFFQPLIFKCLDRNPSRRPSFQQIIPILHECQAIGRARQMRQFDIPRMRGFLWSSSHKHQLMAAREMEGLLRDEQILRSTSADAKRDRLIALRKSTSAIMSSPPHLLSDKDAMAFIQSLTFLLQSHRDEIQLQCLNTLNALLWASRHDQANQEKDRKAILDQGLRRITRLVAGNNMEVRKAASELVLSLTESEHFNDARFINQLQPESRKIICEILRDDLEHLEREEDRIKRLRNLKQDLLSSFTQNKLQLPISRGKDKKCAVPPPLPPRNVN
uniref:Non-specific serine/threonine protein kinase n=1 Tax=Amorphochlora amoebiformis TaxID=1561963 RepID=A0A7S0H953_9EUKA|mmetsp:Transcript_7332/g.11373  ORF Transcript_7332/g.11373 Transcript_7332/m.11373 type:complete len:790 (+) Transcript_7332:47-2416(+)